MDNPINDKELDWQNYEKERVTINIPVDYQRRIDRQIKDYKDWLSQHTILQRKADIAETDEELEKLETAIVRDFKTRYAGVVAKDSGIRLSPAAILNIWNQFMRKEYREFMYAHENLTFEGILYAGIDKFIYTMDWKRPSDTRSWRNNKFRIGLCAHCRDQFLPLVFQTNHGLCGNCRPMYSVNAIRKFIVNQMETSDRYKNASRDAIMDFYIMFYHDDVFRKLFLAGSESAKKWENIQLEVDEAPGDSDAG